MAGPTTAVAALAILFHWSLLAAWRAHSATGNLVTVLIVSIGLVIVHVILCLRLYPESPNAPRNLCCGVAEIEEHMAKGAIIE